MDPVWKKAVVENNKSFISCSPSDGKTNEHDDDRTQFVRTITLARRVTRGHLSGAGTQQWQRFCTGHRGHGPTLATSHDTSPVPAGTLLPRRSAAAGRGRGQWTLSRNPQPRSAPHQQHHTHLVTLLHCHRNVGWENMELVPLPLVSPVPLFPEHVPAPAARILTTDQPLDVFKQYHQF